MLLVMQPIKSTIKIIILAAVFLTLVTFLIPKIMKLVYLMSHAT